MIGFLVRKIFGSKNDRFLKKLRPLVAKINALEPEMQALADEELPQRLAVYREQVQNGEKDLDAVLPEVFALVREASTRVLGMRHYDVQLLGAMALHNGKIAEMKTGEGKTLVATLAVILNSLEGKGVHVVTVNDYLAKRDAEWMGRLYNFLGLSVGVIVAGLSDEQRKEAYGADITYGTNNEFGFDYLRDNMKFYAEQLVQRGHHYAIVDEVDSILIDEARTPLIISGASDESTDLYQKVDEVVRTLEKEKHYTVDEKGKTASLTDEGVLYVEEQLGIENLYDTANITAQHHVLQSLKAHTVFRRDVDYIVKDDQVVIVDEFTGRLMAGRRFSDGLHQALEAKEHVTVAAENQTLASITFQNYFRMYDKLSGMTGTADTEAVEFAQIYGLEVSTIPPNRPMVRKDMPDLIYRTRREKMQAIIQAIKELHATGQPVLVGTISIETSELISQLLKREGVPHSVLNAKHHEKEAEIVAQAGKLGAVTIATNMAGRGTDIMLGGNAEYMAKSELRKQGLSDELIAESNSFAETDDPEILAARAAYAEAYKRFKAETDKQAELVRQAGGLFIIGTERHESRRIDNQLRGRSGRQGDPGETRFYLSMQDDVMRLFGSERIMNMMETLGIDEDTPIDAKILSGAIENAQKTVEGRNFQSRKNVLEYDDVMNVQRKIIYEQRRQVLDGEDLQKNIQSMMRFYVDTYVASAFGEQPKLADKQHFFEMMTHFEPIFFPTGTWLISDAELQTLTREDAEEKILSLMQRAYAKKEEQFTSPVMREVERVVTLRVVDEFWMDHIDAMDDLRQGIRLRAYAQTDPVIEYKREGFDMFEAMNDAIKEEIVRRVFLVRIKTNEEIKRQRVAKVTGEGAGGDKTVKRQPVVKKIKVGPNDPCPCGSGKKYKKCCRDKDLAAERGQNAN